MAHPSVNDGPFGTSQQRQERLHHFERAQEVDCHVSFDDIELAEIIVDSDAGIIDEDVESPDLLDSFPNLRCIRHVQNQRRHALMRIGKGLPL